MGKKEDRGTGMSYFNMKKGKITVAGKLINNQDLIVDMGKPFQSLFKEVKSK